MYLCYVDDSGDSKNGATLTALLVKDCHWSGLLETWLSARREIHREFGVSKNKELHAVKLFKRRGEFCETPEQERKFGTEQRAAVGRIMLSALGRFEHATVVTVGVADTVKPQVYARFIAWMEDWAAEHDDFVMIFYDGKQGLSDPDMPISAGEQQALWDDAVRQAAPYRLVHRELDITTRRVIEDVVMQDSQYNQLIQAVDLAAYGAYHKHLQDHPEVWGTKNAANVGAIRAYMRLSQRWLADSEHGIFWLTHP